MAIPSLHRQLLSQLRQWVTPKDHRHLQGFAEIVAAILLSQSATFGQWVPYLGHRKCQVRSHLERLSYFVQNDHITAERFYVPLLRQALESFRETAVTLTLDTSMLWNQFCLIEVCLVWGDAHSPWRSRLWPMGVPRLVSRRIIRCWLATAHSPLTGEPWAVLSSQPPSLQTFALYGQRFGGIEPHFKDYKSGAFNVLESGLRNAPALTCLFMLLDSAILIAQIIGLLVVQAKQRSQLDWHSQRGLSFLQLSLRDLARRCYEQVALPLLRGLPAKSPPAACASRRKQAQLNCRFEFAKVLTFST